MTTMTSDQVLEKVREAQVAGRRAELAGTDLRGTDLTSADLTGANLRGAGLTDANLYGADLTNVDLTGADLTDVDLDGATLTGADLTDTRLAGATLPTQQLLDTHGLRPGVSELHQDTWGKLLPANPDQRQLVEHLLNDGWGGTLREAIATVEGLAGQ